MVAFDLEGGSFLPAASEADVTAVTDTASGKRKHPSEEDNTASGQKRPRAHPSEEDNTASGQKRPRAHPSEEENTASGQKRPRADDDNNSEPSGQKRWASGQKRCKLEVQEDQEDDDREDQESLGGKTNNTSVASAGDLLPVFPAHGKVLICAYCNKKADSRSPLVGSSSDDSYGGYLAWNNYTKYLHGVADHPMPFKKPTGDSCGPCVLCYAASGMNSQYGKISNYKKNVIEKNTEETNVLTRHS